MEKDWDKWQYKNLTILLLAFLLSLAFGMHKPFHEFIFDSSYIAAFFAGFIFVFTFGAPIGAVILLILAERIPLIYLLIIAGIGAILSDLTILRFIKDGVAEEIEPVYENFRKEHFRHVVKTRKFRKLAPLVGGLLILTPLPHEMGLSLIGVHKLKKYEVLFLSAFVNIVGILFILLLSFFIKP